MSVGGASAAVGVFSADVGGGGSGIAVFGSVVLSVPTSSIV